MEIAGKLMKGHTLKVLDHGFVRYIDHLGSDERIVEAARISYRAPSKGPAEDQKLIDYLWKNKHTSPFEMPHVVFNIKLPIFVMRQYVRHRMQNLNEVSARYTQLKPEFYIPDEWRRQDTKNKQGSFADGTWNPKIKTRFQGQQVFNTATEEVLHATHKAYDCYERLLDAGVAREMARMVLPLNIYTEIYATWDLKNLLHFIALRDDSHAQAEIQEYGKAIKAYCQHLFPMTMSAYERYKWQVTEQT